MTMLEIALAWAAKGQPVFPVTPCRKEPDGRLAPNGKDDATTAADRITAWWGANPRANVGIRCDGWLVLDVDGLAGEESFALLRDTFELTPTRTFPTPRGRRLAYALPEGSKIGNGTARLGSPTGIDIRAGTRGYILAPGCVHPSGETYPAADGAPIAAAPVALVRALEPPPPRPPAPRAPLKVADGDGTSYGLRALELETSELAATPHGRRHDRLYLAACRLGELEAGGELREGVAEAELLRVLHAFPEPCDVRNGEKTIRDGLSKGSLSPRSAPETTKRKRVVFAWP